MEPIDKKLVEKLSSAVHLVKKSFECTICMDFFDNAVITNCQHTFCRKCIENYIGSKRSQSCPLCKNTINLRSLKQFSSLDPFILKTKNLEEQFNKELNPIKAAERAQNSASSTKVKSPLEKPLDVPLEDECDKNSSKSSSCFSSQVLRSRGKKRIITSEESVPCSKKVKSSQNELSATNSVITSTRQDNKMVITNIDDDQLNKSLNLNETIKIPFTNKVTDWLEKNEPGTSKALNKDAQKKIIVKSSISISRIENKENENLNDDTKNMTKSIAIFDGSIGELSTDPNDSNKKEIIINEADINPTEIKKPDNNAYDMSKIDYPLKFTNKINNHSINKNSNYSLRHKSDSNLCLTTNTTPKMIRSNYIQTPKSAGSNFFDQPLPRLDLSLEINEAVGQQNESTKKTVRFLKSMHCLKRTQSDSDLSQKNQTTALTCMNCIKKLKSTNTIGTNTESKKETKDQAVQYNFEDLIDAFFKDFARLETFLVKKIYFLLESDILDEILNEYFESLAHTSVQSIPDSPPNQPTVILDTLTVNTGTIVEAKDIQTPISNEIINRRSSAFLNNFTELLSTGHSKKMNRTKRIPALEFTTNEKINFDASYVQDNEKNKNLTLIEDTYVNQADQSLVVEDTPVKTDNRLVDEEIRQINETLSKSASRLQAIANCSSRNRTISTERNENTILYEKEDDAKNENLMVIPDTVQIQNDFVHKSFIKDEYLINEESVQEKNSNDNFKQPQITKAAKSDFDNHSYFLNSLNTTSYNQNQILLSNVTQNLSQKNIPLAKDILGVSLANESMINQSTFNPNQSIMPKINDSASTQSSKLKSYETQLLTDSACQIIENICKDHYSVQNETICEETAPRIALSNITNKSKEKIEFVYSLLPSEMKSIINNYAEKNGIKISNEITESTTHLIVDADRNLLCGVTNKYLKAISRKIWIVSVAWILNCINTTQMIKPDKFEIRGDKSFGVHNGPFKSRTSEKYLLEFHEVLFIGEFLSADSVSLDDLTQLVKLNGGVVKRKAKEFSVDDESKFKIVIFDDKFKKISKKIANTLKQNSIDCVNKSWLIDSLACYKLMNFKEYQTYDK